MKAFLMFNDRDFNPKRQLPWNEQELIKDLELETLFNAMTLGDDFLRKVTIKVVLAALKDPDRIRYRQDILRDCLKNMTIVRDIYRIAVESMEKKKGHWLGIFGRYPSSMLYDSVRMLQMFVDPLKKLRNIADKHADKFESEGFASFFGMLKTELDDEYFATVESHLKALKFPDGVLISAELGKGNEGTHYILRRPHGENRSLVKRILAKKPTVYAFSIPPRDQGGARALSELKERGINCVASALAQSADHIDCFFNMLRTELAFYIGCLNLFEQLAKMGEPISFPVPAAPNSRRHSFHGLYDVCLALTVNESIVGNDTTADDKDLVILTGANQGGKSTFLRSIGLAQLMMQCGMFAPAESFSANICDGLFTHFKREEDVTMESGKLDEELSRMSDIVNHITPNSMVLFNESFGATNEREGSEIARQIICALVENRIKVFFVTHLYAFASGLYDSKMNNAIFLRAEREADGRRTFKLNEGGPLQTGYGQDLYKRIFQGNT